MYDVLISLFLSVLAFVYNNNVRNVLTACGTLTSYTMLGLRKTRLNHNDITMFIVYIPLCYMMKYLIEIQVILHNILLLLLLLYINITITAITIDRLQYSMFRPV
jgi:hypothetical protein